MSEPASPVPGTPDRWLVATSSGLTGGSNAFEAIGTKQTAEQAIDHIVKIMVIFILQTLVIPFLLLWALYGVLRGTFELPRQVVGVVAK